jgi:hypothetical protein
MGNHSLLDENGYLRLTDRVTKLRDPFMEGMRPIERGAGTSVALPPPGMHQIINLVHQPIMDEYLADLAASGQQIRSNSIVARDSRCPDRLRNGSQPTTPARPGPGFTRNR